jgi:hypothetical protein
MLTFDQYMYNLDFHEASRCQFNRLETKVRALAREPQVHPQVGRASHHDTDTTGRGEFAAIPGLERERESCIRSVLITSFGLLAAAHAKTPIGASTTRFEVAPERRSAAVLPADPTASPPNPASFMSACFGPRFIALIWFVPVPAPFANITRHVVKS